MFYPKEVPNLVSAIRIRIDLCFSIANNVVPVEDILDMHSIEYTLTKAARYNIRIQCHYIAWYIKIRLFFNEVNNGFNRMKIFTQGCHNMAKNWYFRNNQW